jgi:hypothetical protein
LVKELNALRDIMFIHAGEEVVGVIGEDAFEKHDCIMVNSGTWELEVY